MRHGERLLYPSPRRTPHAGPSQQTHETNEPIRRATEQRGTHHKQAKGARLMLLHRHVRCVKSLTFERATTARHKQTGAIADCTIGRKHKGTFFEGEIINPCLDGVLRKRARARCSHRCLRAKYFRSPIPSTSTFAL